MGFNLRSSHFITFFMLVNPSTLLQSTESLPNDMGPSQNQRSGHFMRQQHQKRRKLDDSSSSNFTSSDFKKLFHEDTQVWWRRELQGCGGSPGSLFCLSNSLSMSTFQLKPDSLVDKMNVGVRTAAPTLEGQISGLVTTAPMQSPGTAPSSHGSGFNGSGIGNAPIDGKESEIGSGVEDKDIYPTHAAATAGGGGGIKNGVIALISVGCLVAIVATMLAMARNGAVASGSVSRGLKSVCTDSDPDVFEDVPLDD